MSSYISKLVATLERGSAAAFVAAGGLLLTDTLLQTLDRLAGVSTPGVLRGLLMLSGLLAALVGLLGLYPRLVDASRGLARLGAAVTAIAGGTFAVVWGWWLVGNLVPTVSEPIPAVNLLAVGTMVLSFLLFGVVSLRTAVPSRAVGGLLLTVVAVFIGMVIVFLGRIDLPSWALVAVLGVLSVVMLTIGYRLRADGRSPPATSPRDSIAP